jgi:hypothetical protein
VPLKEVNRGNIDPSEKRMASFEKRLQGVEYIIIDEMSMVGRRALGHIDYLLTKARGNNKNSFGGLSIILVGDHGQLPPVKDKRGFDVSGVRNARTGSVLVGAPQWELRGVQRYEEFDDVFFLDKIERLAKGNGDAVETKKLSEFRDLQLRARDGLCTAADHTRMCATMDLSQMSAERRATFFQPDVYALVTTKAKRDQGNMSATTALLDGGAPGVVLAAVHSPENSPAAMADDDDLGLARRLVLALGSRVMVTWNISVNHGLVNGTVGTVVDVLVQDGIAASVLIAVRKASTGRNGYSGPSFVSAARYDLSDGEYAIVAIARKSVTIHESKADSQRSQFPLMLAHAVTIHKAQGLTLSRVRIDAGDDEPHNAVGLLFVALTRVRHPDHIAFDPMPDRPRVTEKIAKKPSLWKRKRHERELREKAARTKLAFVDCNPPPTPTAPALNQPDDEPGDRSDDDDGDSDGEVPDLHGPGVDATTSDQQRLEDQGAYRTAIFNHERVRLSTIGLAGILDCAFLSGVPETPDWIDDARGLFCLKARVIDYIGASESKTFMRYLRFLGFDVTCTSQAYRNTEARVRLSPHAPW